MMSSDLREKLAELCHEQWSGWMDYLFLQGTFHADGSFTIKKSAADRWMRQKTTYYYHLTEKEKDSDRKEADKFIEILKNRNADL